MSDDLTHIKRCLDLQERDIGDAIITRDATRALVGHLLAISAPNTGVAKILLLFARMATTACGWIDGDLSIDLTGEGETTLVDVATDLGGGLRERLLPPMAFKAPLAEFMRAIERVPHMIAPLGIRAKTAKRIGLSASEMVRRTTVPPPPIEISTESLFVRISAPGVPREGATPPTPDVLPVVAGAKKVVEVPAPAAPRGASEPPVHDLDRGWDD